VADASFIKLYRPGPRWLTWGWIGGVYYRVLVDGRDVGELWPVQIKTFQVTPGEHEVKLKGPPFRWWRNSIVVRVPEDGVVELACASEWTALSGVLGLHRATAKERASIAHAEAEAELPPPKNLGEHR
jgi:hypothetical protein